MNPHMTDTEWAFYIQQFDPQTEQEYLTYLKDLFEYSRRGNIECGISELRCRQISKNWPVLKTKEYIIIKNRDKMYQNFKEGWSK